MPLVPCNRKSVYDDLVCMGLWDHFTVIQRIIKWKVLHLTWNKEEKLREIGVFFLNYTVCFLFFTFFLHMALHFSKHVNITSVILCTFTGASVFECKCLGEVSVATSIYVFKSLVLFVDELMFCSLNCS